MTRRSPSATPGPALIEVRNLKKTYWNGAVAVRAVRGVNLDIREGEFVALMGQSGSRKSTLMNLLAFLDAPSSGQYRFAGQNTTGFDAAYRAVLRNQLIGFVFQQFFLLPRTSSVDNVRLPLLYNGVSRREQTRRAVAMLEKVGLGDRLEHRPNELSGGQQQRVSIARALVNDPKVLFCDEPTGNLDSETSAEIMAIFNALHREGKTIVMVTHEDDIAAHAERIIRMKDGKIL
jgi:putative ABC transport system ATP-binding protein